MVFLPHTSFTLYKVYAYLYAFYDSREPVRLTVFSQQILTDATEGKELVIKCLEV